MGRRHRWIPWVFGGLLAHHGGLGCSRPSDDGGVRLPAVSGDVAQPARTLRVGNQVEGVESQPDYDRAAREVRRELEPRLPSPLPAPPQACAKMLAAVAAYYAEADGPESPATSALSASHERDLAACIDQTSPAAASCVTLLVQAERGEYPWLVDQCDRAFPRTPAAALVHPAPGTDQFAEASAVVASPREKSEAIELTFVGDVIFGRYRANGYDPIPEHGELVFADVAPLLRSDLLVGNLETPLVRELPVGSPIGSRFRFGASFEMARQLVDGTFAAVSLANNHWFDMRETGVTQTPKLLAELGIVALGAAVAEGTPFLVSTVERNGWQVGFVALTTRTNAPLRPDGPHLPYIETAEMGAVIGPLLRGASGSHDLLVVVVHWGDEYAEEPSRAQIRAAHALIDAGANLVIGHHPHVLQGIERYRDGVVAYSLGNFVFENTHEIPRQTGVLRVRYRSELACPETVRFHPAYLKRMPVQHPVPATGGMNTRVKRRVRALGAAFATRWEDDGDDLVLASAACGADPR